jgi:hypothetical protein
MDDVPDQAVHSVIADEASSGSKARTAAIGLACLNWIEAAAARSRGAPLKRYGPSGALTAGLFGLACLGWSSIQRPGPTLPRVEINLSAQKTTEESHARRAEAEAMHAVQSLNTKEVSAPEPANPSLEAAKDEASPGLDEAAGKTSRLPPKPMEKLANGSDRIDRIGLKIAALLAVDPVVDHSASATLTRRREQKARHDAFNPSQHPNAPGAPRPLGTIRSTAPANKGERRLRIRATGQLIASFGHAGEAQAKLGATLVA